MNTPNAFHFLLKQIRKEHGMTQADAAKHLKIARQTYLDLENGKTPPRRDTLMHYLHCLIKVFRIFLANVPH